jgi:predicted RecA/RadA family phage recombinase
MADAVFRHGSVDAWMDYTPAANVAAGDVVVLGANTGFATGIAHLNIANGVQGALACGGGVYDVVMLTNIAPYATVYWDDTNNKVVTTSTLPQFGYLLTGNTGANTTVRAFHDPKQGRQ